ncbi:transposase [Cytobacillus sp. NCCP-133]|nr:transposase [Cytobacillus sp. NCCP-133]
MVKYDEGFKQSVVNAYLAGEGGYASLANRFGIRSKTNIRKWVSAFLQFGKQGLTTKKSNTNFLVQFKLDVLNYKERTGDSLEEVARKFGITDPPMIHNWLTKWQNDGIEGLSKSKGRPLMSNKPKKKKNEKKMTKEDQLLKEIELLRAENAYLKKLRASGINIPNRLLKQNPGSSTNSEKNSN